MEENQVSVEPVATEEVASEEVTAAPEVPEAVVEETPSEGRVVDVQNLYQAND